MPRVPLHTLTWSPDQGLYELYTQGQLQQCFRPTDEAAWLAWLSSAASFAFHGASGSINVYQEARSGGGQYWYAYHTSRSRTRKRYLGRTARISFARLEETALTLASEPVAPEFSASRMQLQAEQPPLLSTRLAPPRLPHALVAREHLLSALDGALSTRLSLLSAPAGWGKTTLLSAWASRHQAQVAWLSLDELDTSPTRFWVSLIAALRRCRSSTPDLGETALALLQSPQPPPLVACLSTLLLELEGREAHPAPIVLIVDDYQVITDPAIHEGMSLFLEHLPAHLHLILASRVDPELPLARWRVRGQLTEIRADDLRFGEVEASHFLSHMLSPPLSTEEVHLLTLRTEGWIAGLHLAALALQKREDRAAFLQAFTGSQRYLLDYIQEEILARLPESARHFLLCTCILSRLEASVCQAVTAEPEKRICQQMLEWLERRNLFLVPLDEERRWYRLHDLFREALLASLHTTRPETMPLLHNRAAQWYETQGDWSEAIAHRLAAKDFSAAARLMEQTGEQFWVRGEAATMARWVLALPEQTVREHARLVLTTAFYLLDAVSNTVAEQRARIYRETQQLMARVETVLLPQADETSPSTVAGRPDAVEAFPSKNLPPRAAEDALLLRRLRLLRTFMVLYEAIATGAYERSAEYYRILQEEMQELDRDEEVIWQLVPLACSFLLYYTVRRGGAELLPRLLEAKRRVVRSGSRLATIKVMQWLALVAVRAGHLRLAYQESLAAHDLLKRIANYALLKGYFDVVLARVLYQWNRLEEARDLLRTVVHDAAAWQQLDVLASGYADLIKVETARGDWSAAQQALREVEQLVLRERSGTYPSWLPPMRAHWWLAQGQVKEASDWAAGVVFPEGAWKSSLYDAFPVVMRVYFAQRSFREAVELLDRWNSHLDRPANMTITLTFLAQSVVALYHAGKQEQAWAALARLLILTEPEGYIHVYLDEGEPMRQVLQMILTTHSKQHELAPSTTAYLAQVVAVFEPEKLHGRAAPLAEPLPEHPLADPGKRPSGSPVPVEPLTQREQEVLRLLSQGTSNQEIADALVIELSTVKKHVSNLLSKLGAESRTQAITRARTLSLL